MASGGSVVGIKYDGGVLIAADTLLSYGGLAKVPNAPRLRIVGRGTCIGATGDYADFQALSKELIDEIEQEKLLEDGIVMDTPSVFSSLHRTAYYKRGKFEPYMCETVVAGTDNAGEAFLGAVDSIGTRWTDECIATGYGGHICIPLMRSALKAKAGKLTKEEAMRVLHDCLRGLFYRECRALNRFTMADCSQGTVKISEPFSVDTEWGFQGFRFEATSIIR